MVSTRQSLDLSEHDHGGVIRRVLTSPWNLILLVVAVVIALVFRPELPTNPRDGWSTVGGWLQSKKRPGRTGTPFVFGPYQAGIYELDGLYIVQSWHQPSVAYHDGRVHAGFVDIRLSRERLGFLAPTRETWTREVDWIELDDARWRSIPAERRDEALTAIVSALEGLSTEPSGVHVASELRAYQAGEVISPTLTIVDGVVQNSVFIGALSCALLAVPGSIHALFLIPVLVVRWTWRRSGHPYCASCGYNLTSAASDVCPECGRSMISEAT